MCHAGNAEIHSHPITYKTARRETQYAIFAKNKDTSRPCAKHPCRKEEDHHHKARQAHNQDIRTPTHPAPETTKTRRVRHIKDNTDQTETQNYEGEPDELDDEDAEAALYIKELTEDWANVNLIRPTKFHAEKNSVINNEGTGEFWVATTTNNKRIVWLADTGSPRTFMNKETANELLLPHFKSQNCSLHRTRKI